MKSKHYRILCETGEGTVQTIDRYFNIRGFKELTYKERCNLNDDCECSKVYRRGDDIRKVTHYYMDKNDKSNNHYAVFNTHEVRPK